MLDAGEVLIDWQPPGDGLAIGRIRVEPGLVKAHEIPGRFEERVEGVGLAPCGFFIGARRTSRHSSRSSGGRAGLRGWSKVTSPGRVTGKSAFRYWLRPGTRRNE